MRSLSVAAMISLDGVMQAPGGPEHARTGLTRCIHNPKHPKETT